MHEFWGGVAAVCLYIIPAATVMLVARKLIRIPDELFRKILHFILLGAYIPFLFAFETWWHATALAAGLMIILYPALALAERIPAFSTFVNERKKGELKRSMVLALLVMLVSIAIGWGGLGDRFLVLASVYAWGVGDAFAALIGKRFGRHKIRWRYADPHKSLEGSLAMFATSTLSVCTVLLIRGGLALGWCMLVAAVAAAASTVVELCTNRGYDTVSCPAVAMAIILPLTRLLGG